MGERHGLNLNSVEARPHPGGKDGWMHGDCTVEGCEYTASAPRLDGLIGLFEEHDRGKRESRRTYHPTDQDVREEVRRMRDATQRTPLRQRALEMIVHEAQKPWLDLLEQLNAGEASDGHHTHNELYSYRLAYNALLFNEWARHGTYPVAKSWRHHDGEPCFGVTEEGNRWFIVTAELPNGQVSNHYRERYWGMFNIPVVDLAPEWDGHNPNDALLRLTEVAMGVIR